MPQQATTASNTSCTQYLRSLHPKSVSGIISRIHLDALLLGRKFTSRLFGGEGEQYSLRVNLFADARDSNYVRDAGWWIGSKLHWGISQSLMKDALDWIDDESNEITVKVILTDTPEGMKDG
ncbi:hypothetical protein CDAR_493301 [Caerostris darwini]|uniref:Uncharacterized protein n=1 Tax=Caerostris darwini TaxID=1538125 RepID=A0AAV4RXF8_9ARAC|nr:hypothetical protein CDAR_493301 [Caerostris darwini]